MKESDLVGHQHREYDDHYNFLLKHIGNVEIIGETPDLLYEVEDTSRGLEIKQWLNNEFGEPCTFVIIDDDNDMDDLIDHLILTDYLDDGLTSEIADKVISILNR